MNRTIGSRSAILVILLFSLGCNTGFEGSVDPGPTFTGNDPFNDLTVMGERFYLTNFDQYGGDGNHINLYSFDLVGQPVSVSELQMNGQGYISIANADGNLFLFSQMGLLLRVTPFGEYLATNWLGSGFIGWQAGGLLGLPGADVMALLWNSDGFINACSLDPFNLSLETVDTLSVPNRLAFRSMCASDLYDSLFVLYSDQNGADFIGIFNPVWIQQDEMALSDSLVSGISYLNGEIWISTEDRRIIPLSSIQQ